jgi:nucleoside-diphosphate-sugar epimerase
MPDDCRPLVVITGVTGKVGGGIVKALADTYQIVGIDRERGDQNYPLIETDLTSDASVRQALDNLRDAYGAHIASVLHLAGYFDFNGDGNLLYQKLNVEGTRRLIEGLQRFHVEQFVYSGTMLVHETVKPGEHTDENRPLDPTWAYPKSKAAAEAVIREWHGAIPCVLLHLAGVYDDETLVPNVAQP